MTMVDHRYTSDEEGNMLGENGATREVATQSLERTFWVDSPDTFSSGAFAERCRALTLGHRLACASAMYRAADEIAAQAAEQAAEAFLVSGRIDNAQLTRSCRRDLALLLRGLSASVAGGDRHGLEVSVLSQLVLAARAGMEFADASALLLDYAVLATQQRLSAEAAELCVDHLRGARSFVRNGSAGAVLATHAAAIAGIAWEAVASSHPQAVLTYGPSGEGKCIRDMSMILGAAQAALAAPTVVAAQRAWMSWIFDRVGRYIGRYSGSLWRATFAGLLRGTAEQLAWSPARTAASAMYSLACADTDARSALQVFVLAPEIARSAAMVVAKDSSASDAALYCDVFTDVLRFAAVDLGTGNTGLRSSIAEYWLESASTRLPTGDSEHAETAIRTLHATASKRLGVHYGDDLDLLLRIAVAAAHQFASVSRLLPAIAQAATRIVARHKPLDTVAVAAAERWVCLLLTRAAELSCRGDYSLTAERWWAWIIGQVDPDCGVEAGLRARLMEEIGADEIADSLAANNEHLSTYLADIGAQSPRYHAVSAARVQLQLNVGNADPLIAGCARQILFALLLPEEEGLGRAIAGRYLAHTTAPLVELLCEADPAARVEALTRVVSESCALLEESGDPSFTDGLGALKAHLLDCASDLGIAEPLFSNSSTIAGGAIAHLQSLPLWTELAMDQAAERCVRDVTIVLRMIALSLGDGGSDPASQLRAWSSVHLLPFLAVPTRTMTEHLPDCIEKQIESYPPQSRARIRALLDAVYGVAQD